MHRSVRVARLRRMLFTIVLIAGCAACSAGGATTSTSSALPTASSSSSAADSAAPSASSTAAASQDEASQGPDTGTGTGTSSGDVPDNAVFLTYRDTNLGYSIQYVEGWQVAQAADGVAIRDKDSSETVRIVRGVSDIPGFVTGTDLPSLRSNAGFKLLKQDQVTVKGKRLVHLLYDIVSPPDPVTGKQVPQAVDQYYVPGTSAIAVVTLATPKGVDNVDAFRQMIESFRWT
jgi:hypothetical protein